MGNSRTQGRKHHQSETNQQTLLHYDVLSGWERENEWSLALQE